MVRFTLDYLRAVFGAFGDAHIRPYLAAAAGLIVLGTSVYVVVERWSVLDAAYFSVITLATVGFGDLAPVTPFGKIFTMAYIVFGLGILGTLIANLTRVSMHKAEKLEQEQRMARSDHHLDSGESARPGVARAPMPEFTRAPDGSAPRYRIVRQQPVRRKPLRRPNGASASIQAPAERSHECNDG